MMCFKWCRTLLSRHKLKHWFAIQNLKDHPNPKLFYYKYKGLVWLGHANRIGYSTDETIEGETVAYLEAGITDELGSVKVLWIHRIISSASNLMQNFPSWLGTVICVPTNCYLSGCTKGVLTIISAEQHSRRILKVTLGKVLVGLYQFRFP